VAPGRRGRRPSRGTLAPGAGRSPGGRGPFRHAPPAAGDQHQRPGLVVALPAGGGRGARADVTRCRGAPLPFAPGPPRRPRTADVAGQRADLPGGAP
jgi:hypothetical protein